MKRINLDQMKNMSIDNLIELYRSGYRLEEYTSITSLSNLSNFSNIHTLQGPLLDPAVNFGKVTVSTGYDAVATSIILNTNEGSKLPDPSFGAFNLVWWNSTDYPDPSDDPNKEIVRCTARTTDTLTVTRPQEGTSASVKNLVGKTYKMILSPTAKMISDISSAITARVVKGGDTMIGTLNLPTNGLIVGTNQLIVSGGNVGIGTTGPISKLDVQVDTDAHISFGNTGAIATGDGYLRLGYDGINEYGWISPYLGGTGIKDLILQPWGGNVGIGTTSPGYPLHVYRPSGYTEMKLESDASGKDTGLLFDVIDTTYGNAIWKIGVGVGFAGNGLGIYEGSPNPGTRMVVTSGGNVGIGTTSPGYRSDINGSLRITGAQPGASSGAGVEIHYDSTNNKGQIYAYDRTAGSSKLLTLQEAGGDINLAANKMFINGSSGNVGIGITSPQQLLHLLSANGEPFVLISNGGTNYQGLYLGYSTTNTRAKIRSNEPGIANRPLSIGGQTIAIQTSNAGNIEDGTSNVAIFIDAGQNVGIGTMSPRHKLDSRGNLFIGTQLANTSFTTITDTIYLGHPRKFISNTLGVNVDGSNDWINLSAHPGSKGIILGTSGTTDSTPHNAVNAHVVIQSGGNVGIGTTNPTAKLHIGGTAGVDGIKFPDGTTQTTAATLTRPKTTGSFTGNGSANRAIAHGLGMVPFQVMLWDGLRTVIIRYKNAATPVCQNNHVENGGVVDTTLWDTTYFYVTGATEGGNTTGATEYWTAYA